MESFENETSELLEDEFEAEMKNLDAIMTKLET